MWLRCSRRVPPSSPLPSSVPPPFYYPYFLALPLASAPRDGNGFGGWLVHSLHTSAPLPLSVSCIPHILPPLSFLPLLSFIPLSLSLAHPLPLSCAALFACRSNRQVTFRCVSGMRMHYHVWKCSFLFSSEYKKQLYHIKAGLSLSLIG